VPDLGELFSSLTGWLPGVLSGGAGLKLLQHILRVPPDLPVCKTRIIREGRSFPWNRQVAIHALKDGRVQITPIYARDR